MVDGSVSSSWLWILGLWPGVHVYEVLGPMLCGRRASAVFGLWRFRLWAKRLVDLLSPAGFAGRRLALSLVAPLVRFWLTHVWPLLLSLGWSDTTPYQATDRSRGLTSVGGTTKRHNDLAVACQLGPLNDDQRLD